MSAPEPTPQSLLARLQPVLEEEGLEIQVVDLRDGLVHLRGRRVSPGVPMAFMVRALEGTFRRYLSGFKGVVLDEWEDLEERKTPPRALGPIMRGLPGLDLTGTDRREAASALDIFAGMLRRQGARRARLLGVGQGGAEQALEKWLAIHREAGDLGHPEAGHRGRWILHLGQACEDPGTCGSDESGETLPAGILLAGQP